MTESKTDIENRNAPGASPTDDPSAEHSNSPESAGPAAQRRSEASAKDSDSTQMKKSDLTAPGGITDLKDRQLGDFRLLRRIGRGGMAEVYLAEQISLKRKVAVKVLREEMLADDVHLKRFEQEAKTAGGLNHPHIVQVYTIGFADGIHYIAQEYVQGQNLREYLTRNGPPELTLALKFMTEIASALQTAGEARIVHRDIKPENILITRKDEVKVTDFGLAQLSLPGERLNLTQVGMTMGTPLYMSPEQVNGRNVDHRSDLYSLGVTFYHMLCGVTPFRGETVVSVAVQHVNNEPPPLKEQRPDLPDVVCRVIHKMMAKNPDDRYQNAATLLEDLNRIADAQRNNPAALAKMRLTETPVHGYRPWRFVPFVDWRPATQAAVFLGVASVVALIAAGIGWIQRPPNPMESPPAKEHHKVPKMETVLQQYFRAMQLDDEASWNAVIEYWPEPKHRRIRLRAKEALASLYLRTGRYSDAKRIYRGFTIEDNKDENLKAAGFAGLAIIASAQGDYLDSQRIIIDDLRPLLQKGRLTNSHLNKLVEDAFRRNQEKLKDRRSKMTPEEIFGPRNPPTGNKE